MSFGKCISINSIAQLTLLSAAEFGPMAFISHSQGKRYVWECNDRQSLANFIQSLAAATFKPPGELEHIFVNMSGKRLCFIV